MTPPRRQFLWSSIALSSSWYGLGKRYHIAGIVSNTAYSTHTETREAAMDRLSQSGLRKGSEVGNYLRSREHSARTAPTT